MKQYECYWAKMKIIERSLITDKFDAFYFNLLGYDNNLKAPENMSGHYYVYQNMIKNRHGNIMTYGTAFAPEFGIIIDRRIIFQNFL